ncbi:MAG: hypothetical protein ACREJN_21355 [Nitrospiraceae bacterium]
MSNDRIPGIKYPTDIPQTVDPSIHRIVRNIYDNLYYLRGQATGLSQDIADTINNITNNISEAITKVTQNTIINTTGSKVIVGTHNQRITTYGAASDPVGTLFIETDRQSIYYISDAYGIKRWVWGAGMMTGPLNSRPTDLTPYDLGFSYTSTELYLKSDYVWNGASWIVIGGPQLPPGYLELPLDVEEVPGFGFPGPPGAGGGGGSGALTLIAENLLTVDTAVITFSTIPGTYRNLRLVYYGRITEATTDDYPTIRFNNDSGSNYDYQRSLISSTSIPGGQQAAAQTSARSGDLPGTSSSRSGQTGMAEIVIPMYAGTTLEKCASVWGGVIYTGSSGMLNYAGFVAWRSTSAITQIDLSSPSGKFVAGSLFSLYGMQ